MRNVRVSVMFAALALAASVQAQQCPTDDNSEFTSFLPLDSSNIVAEAEVKVDILEHDFDAVKVAVNKEAPLSIPMTRLTDVGLKKQFTFTIGPAKSKAEVVIPQGQRVLIVSTYKGNVCTSQARLEVDGADSRVSAVIVGINDYKVMRDLKFAEQDARAFEQLLRQRVPEKDLTITTLLGAEATKKKIEKAIFDATRPASDQGTVLLYFSGHGLLIEERANIDAFLVPYDSESAQFPGDFIKHSAIMTDMRDKTLAKHRIVILDSCFSGLPLSAGALPQTSEFAKSITPNITRRLRDLAAVQAEWRSIPPEVVWFSGSGPMEVSYEAPEFNHGLFTHFLLTAGEHSVSYSKLFENVKTAIQEYKKFKQTPELLGATGKFQTLKFPLTADEP